MWYTEAFSLERYTDSADASHADTKTIASQSHQCKMLQSDVPNQWLKLVRKLNFRDGKMQAILAFLDDLSKEESVTTRDKIICEFGQATYEYVIQFPIVLQSMPTMTLPCLIYDYKPTHMQQLYCRSQMRQIESYCQFRDLAVIVRDEQLSAGTAYDPATVKPLSWANIASVV